MSESLTLVHEVENPFFRLSFHSPTANPQNQTYTARLKVDVRNESAASALNLRLRLRPRGALVLEMLSDCCWDQVCFHGADGLAHDAWEVDAGYVALAGGYWACIGCEERQRSYNGVEFFIQRALSSSEARVKAQDSTLLTSWCELLCSPLEAQLMACELEAFFEELSFSVSSHNIYPSWGGFLNFLEARGLLPTVD